MVLPPLPQFKEKIIVIAGDPVLCKGVIEALNIRKYSTIHIPNGVNAHEILSRNVPDLIILDIGLNGVDSYGILENVHLDPKLADVPLFLVSTQGLSLIHI